MSKRLFWISFLPLAMGIGAFSAWFLVQSITWQGKAIACIGLLGTSLPLFIWQRQGSRERAFLWRNLTYLSIILIGGLVVSIFVAAPAGHPPPQSPIQHRFLDDHQFHRFTPTNLIPEIEQINLGYQLMPFIDPILTREQARESAVDTLAIYREMEGDANFQALGSMMGLTYENLLPIETKKAHYFLYIPHSAPAEPLPAVIFLHGSAGNFKAYTYIFSKLAEAENLVIIAPSYGFGSWDAEGAAFVLELLADVQQTVQLDPEHIYLAGLSNGGIGALRTTTLAPNQFAGLILLSPVMPNEFLISEEYRASWEDRPVLIITGESDRRIPLSYVQDRAEELEARKAVVTLIQYPGEDHFLTFSQSENVIGDIGDWINADE